MNNLIRQALDYANNLEIQTITHRMPWIEGIKRGEPGWTLEQESFVALEELLQQAASDGNLQEILQEIGPLLAEKRIQILTQPGYEGTLVSHWEARRGKTARDINLTSVIRNVDVWRKTFERLNQGDEIAENATISTIVEAHARAFLDKTEPMHVLNIGARPGTAKTTIETLRTVFGQNASIRYSGTNHIAGQLDRTREALQSQGFAPEDINLKKGVFGQDVDPTIFGVADLVILPHVYHAGIYKGGLKNKLDPIIHDNTLVIAIYNESDALAALKDGPKFGSLFRPDQSMADTIVNSLGRNADDFRVLRNTFIYQMKIPVLSEDDWHFIANEMPTAVYDRDWEAERGTDFQTAMDLIAFKIHVPLNALPLNERRDFVMDLRRVLETNGHNIEYTVQYVVGHASVLSAKADPQMQANISHAVAMAASVPAPGQF